MFFHQARNRWRQAGTFSLAEAAEQLKKKMEHEHAKQMDLLETIRILRGIPENEFYQDLQSSSEEESEGEEEEEEIKETTNDEKVDDGNSDSSEEEITTPQDSDDREDTDDGPNGETDNDESGEETDRESENMISVTMTEQDPVNKKIKAKKEKTRGCRVDSRWPQGHPLHTKPEEPKYFSIAASNFRSRSKKVPKIQRKPTKELHDYELWREQLLQIAYLKEFDSIKGKSIREFSLPLPDIVNVTNKYSDDKTKDNMHQTERGRNLNRVQRMGKDRKHRIQLKSHHNSINSLLSTSTKTDASIKSERLFRTKVKSKTQNKKKNLTIRGNTSEKQIKVNESVKDTENQTHTSVSSKDIQSVSRLYQIDSLQGNREYSVGSQRSADNNDLQAMELDRGLDEYYESINGRCSFMQSCTLI